MSEMIERLARAAFEATEKHTHETFPGRFAKMTWEHDGSDPRSSYYAIVSAVLEAMREPTKPMLDALNGCGGDTDAIWPAMIDAALSDRK